MPYKTIATWLNDKRSAPAEIAIRLAQEFGSHLVGLNHIDVPRMPPYLRSYLGEEVARVQLDRAAQAAQAVGEQFKASAGREGLPGVEVRTFSGDALDALATHARYTDLIVIGQPDPSAVNDVAELEFPDHAILSCARPVLLVPYAGSFADFGRHAVIAWNASREATRAVNDAMPLLRRAKRVTVITGDARPGEDGHGDSPGSDIALYLARHGVSVTVSRESTAGLDVGALLLSRIADLDGDLLVMGAYGHSRLRELVLGGVTRTILQSMTVPVLMSH